MDIDFSDVNYLKDPNDFELKADFTQFLLSLDVPTIIDITGANQQKTRVITTLLHGNEPSGLIALHRWLTRRNELPLPAINLRFIIVSVEAATTDDLFTHRYLPDGLDINRCFGSKLKHGYFTRANLIEQAIREVTPDAIVDLHNTSGSGPAFAVSSFISIDGLTLASFFTDTMILSGIRLGALMELNFDCPTVTIECGGANDEQSHTIAFEGIAKLACCESLSSCAPEQQVSIVHNPLRLQIKPHVELHYAGQNEGHTGVTLCKNIERFNYGLGKKGQLIGWTDNNGLNNLQLFNESNENIVNQMFTIRDNQIVCATNMRIFMATSKKDIAESDCLFYLVNQS